MRTFAAAMLLVLLTMPVGCTSSDGSRYDFRSIDRHSLDFLGETVAEGETQRKRNLATAMQFSDRGVENAKQRRLGRAFFSEAVEVNEIANFRRMLKDLGDEFTWDGRKIRHSTFFGMLDSGDP